MHPILVIMFVMFISYSHQVTAGPYPSVLARSGGYPKIPAQWPSPSQTVAPVPLYGCGERAVQHKLAMRAARIVGGSETPYGAYPWQVQIQVYKPEKRAFQHHCGGALISSRLVVTAAHCIKRPIDQLRLVVGNHRLNVTDQFEQSLLVERAILHPKFEQDGPASNDIALLVLSPALRPTAYAHPICLPGTGEKSAVDGARCVVSGWGRVSMGVLAASSVLRAAAVPLLPQDTCRGEDVLGSPTIPVPILDGMLCAGSLGGGVGFCKGDSGGPLACQSADRFVLTGLVSWTVGCAKRNRPGVYTRVAHYSSWIQDTAADLGLPPPGIAPH